MQARGMLPRARLLETVLQPVGRGDAFLGGSPGAADAAGGVDTGDVAATGYAGDLGEDTDATAGKAEEAVDMATYFLHFVTAGGKGDVAQVGGMCSATQTAQNVEVDEPAV